MLGAVQVATTLHCGEAVRASFAAQVGAVEGALVDCDEGAAERQQVVCVWRQQTDNNASCTCRRGKRYVRGAVTPSYRTSSTVLVWMEGRRWARWFPFGMSSDARWDLRAK